MEYKDKTKTRIFPYLLGVKCQRRGMAADLHYAHAQNNVNNDSCMFPDTQCFKVF